MTVVPVMLLAASLGMSSPAVASPAAAPTDSPSPAVQAVVADSLGIRDIPIIFVADPTYRSLGGWRYLARSVIGRASRKLEALVGIRFTIRQEVAWDRPGDSLALEQLLREGHAAFGGTDGLVVLFAGPRVSDPGDLVMMGHAYLGNQTMVVAPHQPEDYIEGYEIEDDLLRTFLHEFGHVMGIPHLKGRNLMSGRWDEVTGEFNELSLDVLRANRTMRFGGGEPFQGCDLAVLRDVYLFWDEQGDGEVSLLFNLGLAFLREQRPVDARQLFERASRASGVAAAARLGLSRCALAEGDTAAARGFAAEASADSTMRPDLMGAIAHQWLELGDTLQAERLFTRSIVADSSRFAPWYDRARVHYRQGRFAQAAEDLERAIALEEHPPAWFNLGLALEKERRFEEALHAFRRYLELAPEGPMAKSAARHLEQLATLRKPPGGR